MERINYSKYVEELIDMIFVINYDNLNNQIFGKRARDIGIELVSQGGGNALFICIDMMIEKIQNEYDKMYIRDIIELELCWDGLHYLFIN